MKKPTLNKDFIEKCKQYQEDHPKDPDDWSKSAFVDLRTFGYWLNMQPPAFHNAVMKVITDFYRIFNPKEKNHD